MGVRRRQGQTPHGTMTLTREGLRVFIVECGVRPRPDLNRELPTCQSSVLPFDHGA